MKLLTAAASNAKTAKNILHDEYLTFILHLAPADLSGYNTCPKASAGCKAACLNTAGRGAFSNVQAARVRKTLLFVKERKAFLQLLANDIDAAIRKASKQNKQVVIRLNGTSDIDWTSIRFDDGLNCFERYPSIQWYDYTKRLDIVKKAQKYSNYSVTFSRSEVNETDCVEALKLGVNVAVVFAGNVPSEYLGHATIDGDSHDLRFLDSKNSIVALKAKGKARRDSSGFVLSINTCASKKGA